MKEPDLTSGEIKKIKTVAVDLLEKLKAEISRIDHWWDKELTRHAVKQKIQDYLWDEKTGLPEAYSETDVQDKVDGVFIHVTRAYQAVPPPYYAGAAA